MRCPHLLRTVAAERRLRRSAPLAAAMMAGLIPFDGSSASEEPTQTPTPAAWQWVSVYKADLLATRAPRQSSGIGNLNLRVDADARLLFGWDDTALHAELLWNHGSKPNRRLASVQGISNLEVAQSAARIYATWIERQFKASGTRVLFGLYDLNSEFYATDASGLLIHPSFGIGIDFSQSGRNGPSIFPNLGLSLRVRQAVGDSHYLQLAAIDGVPGDPDHAGRTVIRLRREEGALLAAEFGWQQPGEVGQGPGPGHWGIGAWRYTRPSQQVDGAAPQPNQGLYAVAQALLLNRAAGAMTGFVRAGLANRHVNSVDLALDAGALIERPLGEHGPAAATCGVAIASFGRAQRAAQAALGTTVAAGEIAFEIGARWQPLPTLALQPVLQRVWHPGGRNGATSIAGLRLEWTLGASKP